MVGDEKGYSLRSVSYGYYTPQTFNVVNGHDIVDWASSSEGFANPSAKCARSLSGTVSVSPRKPNRTLSVSIGLRSHQPLASPYKAALINIIFFTALAGLYGGWYERSVAVTQNYYWLAITDKTAWPYQFDVLWCLGFAVFSII